MFGGNMQQMMKQMGMDMEEIDADKVEVHVGDKKLVFNNPDLSKIDAQGQELFNLQGNYTEEEKDTDPDQEDIELVQEKTDCSEEEAREALKSAEDVAGAVMELQ
ncbi:MAG: nascent polypeptide-associated complex protein [Candidatus Nanohalobium sp.]